MAVIAARGRKGSGDVEKRLGVLEGLLAKSPFAVDLRRKRQAEEDEAARMAGGDVLARDASERRAEARQGWPPLARDYREAVARAIGFAGELAQLQYADDLARADLERANEMRGMRQWILPALPHLGGELIAPEALEPIDAALAAVKETP